MVLARADPHVEGGHDLFHDFRMPRRERGERQVQLIGTHRRHVGFPRGGLGQAHLQTRRQALDAQQEAVEQGIAQRAGEADVEGAGGFQGIERGDIAFVDRRPQVEHLAHLGTELKRFRRRRQAVRHADEEGIVEDFPQAAQRVRYRGRRHVHLFRDVGGVPLAEQLYKNHQQLGIDVDHGTLWLRQKVERQTLPRQRPRRSRIRRLRHKCSNCPVYGLPDDFQSEFQQPVCEICLDANVFVSVHNKGRQAGSHRSAPPPARRNRCITLLARRPDGSTLRGMKKRARRRVFPCAKAQAYLATTRAISSTLFE